MLLRSKFRFLTLIITIATVTACSEITPEQHIESARAFIEENDQASAIIELKNAIQLDTTDPSTRILLAKSYIQTGQFDAAKKELNTAKKLDADPQKIEPLLVKAHLALSNFEQAIELVEDSTSSLPIIRVKLLAAQSYALFKLQELDKSKDVLDSAKRISKPDAYIHLVEANFLALDGKLEQASQVADKAIALEELNSEVWAAKGHLLTIEKKFEEAATHYSKALEIAPYALQYKIFLGQALVNDEQFLDAEPHIDQLLEVARGSVLLNELKATIRYSQSDMKGANNYATTAIQNGSSNLYTGLIAAVSAHKLDKLEQALENFERVIPYIEPEHFTHRLYIATLFELGKLDEAESHIELISGKSQDHDSFVVDMGIMYAKAGRSDIANQLINKASKQQSSAVQAKIALFKLANNDISGVESLETLLDEDPNLSSANIGLAYYYIQQNQYENAQTVISEWLSNNPKDESALLLQGVVKQNTKDYAAAKKWFLEVLEVNPNNTNAALAIANLPHMTGDSLLAYKQVHELASKDPLNFSIAKRLFELASVTDKTEHAISLYEANQESFDNKFMLTRAYAANNQLDKSIDILETFPSNQMTTSRYEFLTRLYARERDYRNALLTGEKWLENSVADRDAYQYVIQLYAANGDTQKAINLTGEAQDMFPNTPQFDYMKGSLLLANSQPKLAQRVIDKKDEWGKAQLAFDRLQGLVYSQQDEGKKAVTILEKVYSSVPSQQSAIDLSKAYLRNNQNKKAHNFLSSVIESSGTQNRTLHLLLAQTQIEAAPKEAIANYQSILINDENNIVAHNNLAWLYVEVNNVDKALVHAKKALDLAGEHPQILDTYGYTLLKSGDIEQAHDYLSKAHQALPDDQEIALHYAASLISNNKLSESKRIISRVTSDVPRLVAIKAGLEKQISELE